MVQRGRMAMTSLMSNAQMPIKTTVEVAIMRTSQVSLCPCSHSAIAAFVITHPPLITLSCLLSFHHRVTLLSPCQWCAVCDQPCVILWQNDMIFILICSLCVCGMRQRSYISLTLYKDIHFTLMMSCTYVNLNVNPKTFV